MHYEIKDVVLEFLNAYYGVTTENSMLYHETAMQISCVHIVVVRL